MTKAFLIMFLSTFLNDKGTKNMHLMVFNKVVHVAKKIYLTLKDIMGGYRISRSLVILSYDKLN